MQGHGSILFQHADCSNTLGLSLLWGLVWGMQSRPEDYDKVVFTVEHRVTKQPGYATGFQDPAEVEHDDPMDLEPAPETGEPPESEIAKQKYLDLTNHPEYPQWPSALLPAGEDKIAILPAYEKVLAKASYLNDRYQEFVSSKSRGYKAPPRHLILTGVPGIGIYP